MCNRVRQLCVLMLLGAASMSYHALVSAAEVSSTHTNLLAPFLQTLDYHAYIDTSYNYLTNKNILTSGDFNRVYDLEQNGFTLQQATVSMSKLKDQGLGGMLTLIAGRDANRSAPSGWNPYFGSQTLAIYSNNAYLQYALSQFTLMGGMLDTLAGIEDVDPTQDVNFSRSILDDAQPGVHIGLRGKYVVIPSVNIFLGIGNGWNTLRQPGRQSLIELGAKYEITKQSLVVLQASSGLQTVVPDAVYGLVSRYVLLDLVASYQINANVSVAMNGDYYRQQKGETPSGELGAAKWQGIAGYVTYQLVDKWSLAARAEIFDDENGFMSGIRQNWREGTLTLQYQPRKDVTLRAETRRDVSNVPAFVNVTSNGSGYHQQSYAVEAIYIFA